METWGGGGGEVNGWDVSGGWRKSTCLPNRRNNLSMCYVPLVTCRVGSLGRCSPRKYFWCVFFGS